MNKVILVGNLTRDPEYQTTPNGVALARFSIAVQRKFVNADGNREADFINCIAWRGQADFVNKYFKKGSRIGLSGSIQTRNYEANDGSRRTATEVVVDDVEFVGPKQDDASREFEPNEPAVQNEEKPDLQPVEDDDLPF